MTTTTYLELEDQATGANNNTWGDVADANFAILEQAIARYTGISTTGGTTTLTSAQNRYPVIVVSGTLVSNAIIQVRAAQKNWIFVNATDGAYTVTVKTSGGTGKTIPRGRATKLYCDGTNVEYLRYPGIPSAQAGGTVDAITATFEPATVAAELVDGTMWLVEAAGANTTTTPSFNPDSTGALTIKKNGGQALAVNDIRGAGHKLLLAYDASGGHVELMNPSVAAASETAAGLIELATDAETKTGTDTARAITPANLTAKEATAAQFRNNTADLILTTDQVWSAADRVALTWTSGGNTAVDLNAGVNFAVTTATGNSTLAAPTNAKTGQSGFIEITQDATTPRTLAFASAWVFAGGADPALTATAGAKDVLFYQVLNATGPVVLATLVKNVS